MPATPPGGRYVPRQDAGTPFWASDPRSSPEAPPAPAHPPLPPTEETIPKDASPLTLVRWYHGQAGRALAAAAEAIEAGDWLEAARATSQAAAHSAGANYHAVRLEAGE